MNKDMKTWLRLFFIYKQYGYLVLRRILLNDVINARYIRVKAYFCELATPN